MEFEARLEERISKKSGKPYKCVAIYLTDTWQKVVLLKDTEIELLNYIYGKKNKGE